MPYRIDYYRIAPDGVAALRGLDEYLRTSRLEPELLELVRLRASLLNGCAYCVDVHAKDARRRGESERRLMALPVWRHAPFFTPRERAALAWTDAVTEIGGAGVSDAIFDEVRVHFTDKAIVDLTVSVIAINGWNRFAISLRAPVDQPIVAGSATIVTRSHPASGDRAEGAEDHNQ